MGSWWLGLGFQPIYGIHMCPTKETQAPTATNHGFPNVRWKEVFISYIDEFADVLSRWRWLQKEKRGNGKRRGRLFFCEFWSTTFWHDRIVGTLFSRSRSSVHFFFQFLLSFSTCWSAIWSFWSLDFFFEGEEDMEINWRLDRKHLFHIYQVERLIFFVSKTKSTRSFDEWRGWWIDRS